ncbi:unnamed protein product [Gordionus sp. m RMFG-2023]
MDIWYNHYSNLFSDHVSSVNSIDDHSPSTFNLLDQSPTTSKVWPPSTLSFSSYDNSYSDNYDNIIQSKHNLTSHHLTDQLPSTSNVWPPRTLTNAQQSSSIAQTFIDTLEDQHPSTSKFWPPQLSLNNIQQRLTFNDISNSQFPQNQQSSFTLQSPSKNARIFHPTRAELVGIIKKLKNHKACGQDLLYSEYLKTDSSLCAEILLPIISRVWFERVCPNDWITATLINLSKTKDPKFLEDWRGI